jgi:ABC-2 type transport system permease protein
MKNIWLLTKVQLGTAFDFNLVSKKKQINKTNTILVAIVIFSIVLSGISFIYSYGIGLTLKLIGALDLLPELVMAVTSLITLMTTIYKVKGTLFGFKDYDMIMSLPVKTSEIVISRLLILYLINILFTVIIIVPTSIAYGVLAKPSPVFYLLSIISVFFVPLVPMIVATVVGTILAVISSKFRHSNIVNIILSIGLLASFMLLSFNIEDESEAAFGEMSATITRQVDDMYPLANMYKTAIVDFNIVSLLLFVTVSVFAFLLFSWFVGLQFKAINTRIASSRTKGNYKVGKLEQASPLKALYRKEIKRYFSSSIYVMNTAFGIVMMTIGAMATLFVSKETLAQVLEVPGLSNMLGNYAPIIISMCVAMTYTTACSISLEGKNLWILKTSPILPKTIFQSKIAVNLTITLPAILINSIIIAIGLKLTLQEFIVLLLMPTAYTLFTAVFGLVINLNLPNFNWTTEVTVIKQSAASMIATLGAIIMVIIPIILFVVLSSINPLIVNGGITIILLIVTWGLYQYLNTKGSKILNSL